MWIGGIFFHLFKKWDAKMLQEVNQLVTPSDRRRWIKMNYYVLTSTKDQGEHQKEIRQPLHRSVGFVFGST